MRDRAQILVDMKAANEWADLGYTNGLLRAVDIAVELGHPEIAEAIMAEIPEGVKIHTCKRAEPEDLAER